MISCIELPTQNHNHRWNVKLLHSTQILQPYRSWT
uniref:Uncharacterized protein n=1 Tax=Manihot esculenta TaxID=3983 RepID=A0A2C9UV44_MANES